MIDNYHVGATVDNPLLSEKNNRDKDRILREMDASVDEAQRFGYSRQLETKEMTINRFNTNLRKRFVDQMERFAKYRHMAGPDGYKTLTHELYRNRRRHHSRMN